jgi:hypothetical protein
LPVRGLEGGMDAIAGSCGKALISVSRLTQNRMSQSGQPSLTISKSESRYETRVLVESPCAFDIVDADRNVADHLVLQPAFWT